MVANHQLRGQIIEYKEKVVKKSGSLADTIINTKQAKYYLKCKQLLDQSKQYSENDTSIQTKLIHLQILLNKSITKDVRALMDLLYTKKENSVPTISTIVASIPTDSQYEFIEDLLREVNISQNYIKHVEVLSQLSNVSNSVSAMILMALAENQVDEEARSKSIFAAIDKDPTNEQINSRARKWFQDTNRLSDLITLEFRKINQEPSALIDSMKSMMLTMADALTKQKQDFEEQLARMRSVVPQSQSNNDHDTQIFDLQEKSDVIQQDVVLLQQSTAEEVTGLQERLSFIERTALPMHKHFEYHCKKYMSELKKKNLHMVPPLTRCRSIVPTGDAIYCIIPLKGSLIATSHNERGEIQVWDSTDAQPVKSFGRQADLKSVWEMCTAGKNKIVVACLKVGGLKVFNWREGTYVNEIKYQVPIAGHGHSAMFCFGPSSQFCAVALQDKTVTIFDINKPGGEVVKILKDHRQQVNCIQTLPNGILASGSLDRTIKFWNLESGKCTVTLVGHNDSVLSLCLVNAEVLASSSLDGTIKLWTNLDSKNPTVIRTLVGHGGPIPTIISLGMNTIASGSIDKTVKVWDIRNGNCISTLSGHTSNILCIAWSNNTLISCDDHQKLRFWTA
jgi:WD40 repeat protein